MSGQDLSIKRMVVGDGIDLLKCLRSNLLAGTEEVFFNFCFEFLRARIFYASPPFRGGIRVRLHGYYPEGFLGTLRILPDL